MFYLHTELTLNNHLLDQLQRFKDVTKRRSGLPPGFWAPGFLYDVSNLLHEPMYVVNHECVSRNKNDTLKSTNIS